VVQAAHLRYPDDLALPHDPPWLWRIVITENLVCMRTPSAEENDRGGLEVAERRVLDRKAGSAKRNPVSAREEIALVNTTNGSYSRRSTD
jgi:hypothetical protein